jgi:hypothetical protein
MGNQFIQMIDGKQVLVSFHGIRQTAFIHGVVVDSNRDSYLVRMNYGNSPLEGFTAPLGSYARPMPAKRAQNWADLYELEAA